MTLLPNGAHMTETVRWTMMRVHHPLHGLNREVSPTARFSGYAPASAPTGVVVADDQTSRFVSVLDGFPHNRWHRDIDWTMGVPGVEGGTIFSGAGGEGATRSIMAMDAGTGAPRWVYAPEGLAADPQRVLNIQVPLTVTVLKQNSRNREALRGAQTPQVAGFGTRAANPILETTTKQIPVNVPQPNSLLGPGHWTNPGLVIAGGRIYGEVNRSIVALDQRTGSPLWRHPLGERAVVHSIVATPEHLLFCMSNTRKGERIAPWEVRRENDTEDFLVALQLDNGKRVWEEPVAWPGTLALSEGLVYFTNGDLHVLGPAERTYDLAADSDRPEDYRAQALEQVASTPSECLSPEGTTEGGALMQPARADASILRLEYGKPLPELLQRVRQRRSAIGSASLVISLDWLTPDRSALRGLGGSGGLTPEWIRAFSAVVEQLAVKGRPAHFDVAPDVNIFLAKNPDQLESVRSLIRSARAMVRDGAPGARTLISFNAEVLAGVYGRTPIRPYGWTIPQRKDVALAGLSLLQEVDEVGLASYPQAAFANANEIPADYFLALKPHLQQKPILITGVTVEMDGKSPRVMSGQAAFLPRMKSQSYWLDAKVVVHPDVSFQEPPSWPKETALQPRELLAAAQGGWERLPRWVRVTRLSVASPELRPSPVAAVGPGSALAAGR